MLLPSPLFSLMEVYSLGVVAYCFDYSSIHSYDCSDYYANLGLGYDSDYDRCYPHTDPVVTAG